MRMIKMTALALISLALVAQTAGAVVLWDQSSFDPFGAGFFNSESGSPPFGSTNFCVNDVTAGSDWVINTITTYYSALDPSWGAGIFQGYVHIFPKTGPLPTGTDDPAASVIVPMTGTLVTDYFAVSATGLSIPLAAGEYWIGITPIAPSGPFGPEIHLSTTGLVGDASASYDLYAFPGPPAWFNFNPGVDASLLIEGDMSVATDSESWSSLKALFTD